MTCRWFSVFQFFLTKTPRSWSWGSRFHEADELMVCQDSILQSNVCTVWWADIHLLVLNYANVYWLLEFHEQIDAPSFCSTRKLCFSQRMCIFFSMHRQMKDIIHSTEVNIHRGMWSLSHVFSCINTNCWLSNRIVSLRFSLLHIISSSPYTEKRNRLSMNWIYL